LAHHGIRVSTLSPAALSATIVTLPSGRLFRRLRLRAGTALTLPAGRFRLCVAQPAADRFTPGRACVRGG
jgi:hypothetical protein